MQRFAGAMLARQLVLGIDVGTSSVKALFLEPSSKFLLRDEIKLKVTRVGKAAEQDPLEYLSAVKQLVKRNQELVSDVIAIGLSGQTPTVICIDNKGNPTSPALIWQDSRAEREAKDLAERFGNPINIVGTSLPWAASACPAKLFWLSRNFPDVIANTRWILQPKDFLGFHITGRAISDPWSSKGLCNVQTLEPIDQLLEYVGWGKEVVPELAMGYESRGETSDYSADYFGFPNGIPVSVGWSDAMSAMFALGVMQRPTSFIITGTSAIVGTSSPNSPEDGANLYVIPTSCSPLAVTYGPTQMSGGAISWMANVLEISEEELISKGSADQGDSVPTFLPYISGERAPLWRSDIRGRLVDIDISHNQSSFARAVMEGISWAERQVIEESERLTKTHNDEVVLGGHAGNDLRWESVRARTLGRSLLRYEDPDITTRGAAMLAYAMITKDLRKSFFSLSVASVSKSATQLDVEYANRNYKKFISSQVSLLSEISRDGKSK